MFTGTLTTGLPYSVLTDLPKVTLRPYSCTHRYATRLACNKKKRDSVQDCRKFLNWLPIEFRTKFKFMTVVFNALQKMDQATYKQN